MASADLGLLSSWRPAPGSRLPVGEATSWLRKGRSWEARLTHRLGDGLPNPSPVAPVPQAPVMAKLPITT